MQLSKEKQLKLLASIPGFDLTELKGCSPAEVDQIACAQEALDLPQSYRVFLEIAGKSTGKFLLGTDLCFPLLLQFKQATVELLEDSSPGLSLPNDSFVFALHQGYSLLYFRMNPDGHESVYAYTEGDGSFTDLKISFTQWLQNTVEEHLHC